MNRSLDSLLRTNGVSGNRPGYNYETLHGTKSQWEIDRSNHGTVLRTYCELVRSGEEENLSLAERPNDIMPVIVAMNLVFDRSSFQEPYDEMFLYTVVYNIQQTIIKDLFVEEESSELLCCILESDVCDDESGKLCKMELRFQFPYCRVDVNTQRNSLYPHLIRSLRATKVLSTIFCQPIGDWDKIIDHEALTKPIVMYGSSNRQGGPVMTFHNVVGTINKDDIINHDTDFISDLNEMFHPCSHSFVQQGIIDRNIFNGEPEYEFWLPVFLSVNYWHKVVLARKGDKKTPHFSPMNDSRFDLNMFGKERTAEINKLDLATTFISMWNARSVLNLPDWLCIGEALYDATEGEDDGCNIWVTVTEKALHKLDTPEFLKDGVQETCDNYYHTFRMDKRTIKDLAWVAREDNKSAYMAWHKNWSMKSYETAATEATHVDVGFALWQTYWLEFVCTHNGKRTSWYHFQRHKLHENPGAHGLLKLVSSRFAERFMAMRTDISAQIQQQNCSNAERNVGETLIGKISELVRKLKDVGFRQRVVTAAVDFFNQDNLESLLDGDPELLGLPNGVLVANEERIYFRKGRPEDYITRCTNTPYKEFKITDKAVQDVIGWIRKVFVDDELYHHFMKFCASCLRGGNNDKILPCFSGVGDNSKSMIVKLFECVFGSYCIKIPISLAAGGRGSADGPSPSLARSKATRICFLEEPEDDEPLKAGILKQITGDDSFYARLLKKNGGDIKPLFTIVLICNKIPSIPNGGKAMKNRFVVIPFLSTWVDNAPESEEEQRAKREFKLDNYFSKKIPGLAAAALWYWVGYYNHYLGEGVRKPPQIVKDVTAKYWEDNDIYYQFTADNIEISHGNKLDVNEVYSTFKIWVKDSYPGMKVADKPKMKAELTQRWGSPTNGVWSGIKIKYQQVNLNDKASMVY